MDRPAADPAAITDHALVRWLQRVRLYDVEAWRAECAAWVQANAGRCVVRPGGTVVTIMQPARVRRRGARV